ncbi:ABC transporter substrate-binding protein [Gorillibacterium sp. sgz5001074]|uniref:ABC transporter substrate-binding protein n=1 Tax=Gorillibacterium sp. sgz5001074 TaxID=3446695 RepID=UPI003F671A41
MQLVEYYHRMHTELDSSSEEITVTLEELAGLLYCSERNVKLILKKMSDQGWIEWIPGRGRGNRSTLRLLTGSGLLLLEEARQYVRDGNVKGAMELINLRGFQSSLKEEFLDWLSGYFGYQEVGEREKRLDTLRLPYYSPILSLDPAEMLFAKDLHLVKQIFDTLVRFDPKERTLKPQLAHFWESDPTGRIWTFYLRKGVRFHHGRELTAEDVVYTIDRLKKREYSATNGWLVRPISRASAPTPYTVRVELFEPNYMFLHYVSAAGLSVLPRDVYGGGAAGNVDRYPIGTGPFRVTRHDDCVCILDAYPDYFLDRALLDRVEIWIMPSDCKPQPEQQRMRMEVDLDTSTNCDVGAGQYVCCPANKIITKLEQGCIMLTFNMKRDGPQLHPRFREAVHRLLDREAMARELGEGELFPAQGFLPPDPPVLSDDSFDPEEGLRLVRESGYQGEPFLLQLTHKHEPRGRWIAGQLARAGIRTQLEFVSKLEACTTERMLGAHAFLGGVVADEDLDMALLEMYQIDNMPIQTYFAEELQQELNNGITAILREPSEESRKVRIRELETALKRDHYVLFLLHPIAKTTFSSVINGVSVNSLGMVNFKDLWFQPQ